jgi:hypothetical protein
MATPPKPPLPIITPIVTSTTPAADPAVSTPAVTTPVIAPAVITPAVIAPPGITPPVAIPPPVVTPPPPPTGVAPAPASITLNTLNSPVSSTVPAVAVQWDKSFNNFHSLTFGLTVTDSAGVSSTNVAKVTVVIQPVAGITGPGTVTAGTPIALDGSTSMGSVAKFSWTLLSTSTT